MARCGPGRAAMTASPATVVTRPPRRWGAGADPVLIPDPDVLVLDEGFRARLVGNAIVERVWTGGDWLGVCSGSACVDC